MMDAVLIIVPKPIIFLPYSMLFCKYDLPHLLIPVITLINPLFLFLINYFFSGNTQQILCMSRLSEQWYKHFLYRAMSYNLGDIYPALIILRSSVDSTSISFSTHLTSILNIPPTLYAKRYGIGTE